MKRIVPFLFLTIALLLPGLLCNAQTVLYYDFEDGQIPAGVTLKRITQLNEYNESLHSISIIDASQGGDQTLNNYDPSHTWPKYNADYDQTGFINSVDLKNPRTGNILTFNDHNDYDGGYTNVQSEMILPVFDFSNVSTSVNIDFWMAQQALPTQPSTNYDYVKLFYSTNGTNWTAVSNGQINRYNSTAQWTQFRATLTNLNGQSTAYIKLRFSLGKNLNDEGAGSSSTYAFYDRILFIDDLKVSITQSLAAPKQFLVLDTAEDAVLAQWTRTASETAWEVLYVPQGTAVEDLEDYVDDNIISVTDAHATIASNVVTVGFPFPETGSWDLYVRAVNSGSYSDWSLRQEITTNTGQVQSMLYNEFDGNQSGGGEEIIGERTIDFETGNLTGFNNTGSTYPWIISTTDPNDGTYCMASTAQGVNYGVSYIEATVNFAVEGTVEFYSRVSSEANYDFGRFYIDGVQQLQESGYTNSAWNYHTYDVTAGSHTFKWSYEKDVNTDRGEDCYYIDDITFYGTSATTIGGVGEYTAMRVSPYCLQDPHGETYDYLDWSLGAHGLDDNSEGEFQGRTNVLEYYPDEQAGIGRYITPLLDFTSLSSSDAVAISFMWFFRHYHTSTGDVVQLQYSLDGSTWTNIGSALQTYNADPHWAEQAFETTALSGKYGYFGLQFTKVIDNWLAAEEDYVVQHHMYLDDWLIRPKQAMAAPLNFTAAGITDSTASFGWNAVTGATSYTLLQVPTGTTYNELDDYLTDNPNAATTVTGTYTTVRDLEDNADFFVRANNGNDHSSWSIRATVTLNDNVTLTDALLYTFTEEPTDLSTWTTKVMTAYTEKGVTISDGEGGYWSDDRVSVYGNFNDTGESLGFSIDEYDPVGAGDEGCLSFFHSTTETDQQAPKARIILAPVDLTDANSAQLDFDWLHNTSPTNTTDKIDILYSMDAGLTWTAIRSGLTRKGSANAWTHYTNSVAAMNGGVALIAIDFYMKAKANADNEENRMYIDNIQVTPIYDCDLPTNVAANFVNDDAATITWTAGTATNWTAICFDSENELSLSDFDTYVEEHIEDGNMVQNVSSNVVTFTSLDSETNYYVFVRANCDEDTHSAWSTMYSFTTTGTGCESLEAYFEDVIHADDFESFINTYTAHSPQALADLQEACYTIELVDGTDNNGGFFVTDADMGNNTSKMLDYYPKKKNNAHRIILPALDLSDGAACAEVSFDYYQVTGSASTTKGYVKLQYCIDGVNWVDVAQINRMPGGLSANGWNHFSYLIEEVAGTYCRLAFLVHAGTTGASSGDYGYHSYLDNIQMSYTPIYVNITSDQTEQDYTIASYKYVTVSNNATFTITNTMTNNGTADNLVIEDGAQLVTSNPVVGTMQRIITGTNFGTVEQPTNAGYYLIASPVADMDPEDVSHMTPAANNGDYDLYAWDATETLEWRNYKDFEFVLGQGEGYLYANTNTATLAFAGQLNASFEGVDGLFFMANDDLHSLTLVGNPFAYQANFSVYNSGAMVSEPNYLTMNATGDGFISNVATNGMITLSPMQAVFVQATDDDESFDVNSGSPDNGNAPELHLSAGLVNIGIRNNDGTLVDNAIVRFNEGSMMRKLYLTENGTRIYIPNDNEEMSIVRGSDQGELPVNFKAGANGNYTISIDNTTGLRYLHLIDNMTGANIDLLQEPSYSFEARTNDYASRFRLVFDANNDNGALDDAETFTYFNGSTWVIDNEGEATLQVIDVMGRVLSSKQINGDAEVNVNEAAGVYMLRLVNGDSVRTQKIVVR